ncbi:MAG: hypothetical protein V4525_00025 [Pseudomonadota bacterium]
MEKYLKVWLVAIVTSFFIYQARASVYLHIHLPSSWSLELFLNRDE